MVQRGEASCPGRVTEQASAEPGIGSQACSAPKLILFLLNPVAAKGQLRAEVWDEKQAQLCVGGRARQTHAVSGEFAPGRAAGRAAGRRAAGGGERLDGAGALGPGWRRCESRQGARPQAGELRGARGGWAAGGQHRGYWPQRPATWLVTVILRVNQGHRICDRSGLAFRENFS